MSPLRTARTPFRGANERVELDTPEFERVILQHGYDARWSKACLCPNRDPHQPDHHRVNCNICDHHGFLYYDPVETKAIVTSLGKKQLMLPESRYQPGMAYVSTLAQHKLSFWDKIELLTAETRFTQVVPLGAQLTKTYTLKYPATEILGVFIDDGDRAPAGAYSIDEAGRIVFSARPQGNFISVSYKHHPVYILIDILHHIRDTRITVMAEDKEIELPTQAVAQLDFLVRDEGATT